MSYMYRRRRSLAKSQLTDSKLPGVRLIRMPALREFPMIKVVHPAYHAFPNGGHPSFCPSGKRRLSWVRVFATVYKCQAGFAGTES